MFVFESVMGLRVPANNKVFPPSLVPTGRYFLES